MLAALLLVLLAGAWWWLRGGRNDGPDPVGPAASQGEITAPGVSDVGLGPGLAARGASVPAGRATPPPPATDARPESGPGRTLVVRVFDERGAAVREAIVRAWAPAMLTVFRRTGEDGTAALTLRGGETTVEVLPPEPAGGGACEFWRLEDIPIPPAAGPLDVVLKDARFAAGVVRDATGAVLPDVTLAVVRPGAAGLSERTDASGRFRVPLAFDGPWDIVVVSRPFPDDHRFVEWLSGAARGVVPGTLDLDITATATQPDRSLTVAVRTEDGHPAKDSPVTLAGGPSLRTDGQGRCTFKDIGPGPWEILVLPVGPDPGEFGLFETVHGVVAEGQTVEVRGRRGARVEGVVRDAAGTPLRDVEVSIVPKGRHLAAAEAKTGADGAFSMLVEPDLACPAMLVVAYLVRKSVQTLPWASIEIPAVPATGIEVRVGAADGAR